MIKLTATFIGLNNSMGFKNGKNYDCILTHQVLNSNIKIVSELQPELVCEYQSFESFTKNWLIIDIDQKLLESIKKYNLDIYAKLKKELLDLRLDRVIK